MFNFSSLEDAIYFLQTKGGYKDNMFLYQKQEEHYSSYSTRIFKTASRIRECLERYPKEIDSYYKAHPEVTSVSYDELIKMNYRELAALRKKLGIRKKSAKKVTSASNAGTAYTAGLAAIENMPVSSLAATIISNEEEIQEESILSSEEIAIMYGEDLPSVSSLRAIGIIPEYPDEYSKKLTYKK